jgi:hypothetical protein
VACFVVVKDVQPEIRPEVTRQSWDFFETADCADATDRRALNLALREVERAAATAPEILLQRDRLLRFFHEFLKARVATQRIPERKQFQFAITRAVWAADDVG